MPESASASNWRDAACMDFMLCCVCCWGFIIYGTQMSEGIAAKSLSLLVSMRDLLKIHGVRRHFLMRRHYPLTCLE
jgi:hypothetical protein